MEDIMRLGKEYRLLIKNLKEKEVHFQEEQKKLVVEPPSVPEILREMIRKEKEKQYWFENDTM
jgi:Mn-dependent DtxR family transcriptional regulator